MTMSTYDIGHHFTRVSMKKSAQSLIPWAPVVSLFSIHWKWIIAGILTFLIAKRIAGLLYSRLRARYAKRVAEWINRHSDINQIVYGSGHFVCRVVIATTTTDHCVQLELLSLDYSKDSPLSTISTTHKTEIRLGHRGIFSRHPLVQVPETIFNGSSELRLIDRGTDYYFLVCQHHYAWALGERMGAYLARLESDLLAIDKKSYKYIGQDHIPGAEERLQRARGTKLKLIAKVSSAMADIGRLVEGLTLRIESLEDFGGLLLGLDDTPNILDDQSQGKPVDFEVIEQDCEEVALILQSYEELLSQT